MCPVKTENMALNVCRAEGEFWRNLSTQMNAHSRGELQKNLLLIALEKINASAASELRSIRELYRGKPLRPTLAVMLLFIFCATIFTHGELRRPSRRNRETEIETQQISA